MIASKFDISFIIIFYGRSWSEFIIFQFFADWHDMGPRAHLLKVHQTLSWFSLKKFSLNVTETVHCPSCLWYWNSRDLFPSSPTYMPFHFMVIRQQIQESVPSYTCPQLNLIHTWWFASKLNGIWGQTVVLKQWIINTLYVTYALLPVQVSLGMCQKVIDMHERKLANIFEIL